MSGGGRLVCWSVCHAGSFHALIGALVIVMGPLEASDLKQYNMRLLEWSALNILNGYKTYWAYFKPTIINR